jgi:predicted alpha/beta-hydrolase family hydrolase
MQAWARRLAPLGHVVAFDYPYMLSGRAYPDRLPVLVAAHREALAGARAAHPAGPVVLVGKSMGGRVGCHVSLEEEVQALVCFGYPLRGAGPKAPIRDRVLLEIRAPVLFVQGTRDALCPLDLLAGVRPRMTARSELHVVDGGDHSLLVKKTELRARGETQDSVDDTALRAVSAFLAAVLPPAPG